VHCIKATLGEILLKVANENTLCLAIKWTDRLTDSAAKQGFAHYSEDKDISGLELQMAIQLLSLGVIGVRLLDRILTASATYPEELADQIVDEINLYLDRAPEAEKALLFNLACEVHDALADRFGRVDSTQARLDVARMMGLLVYRARMSVGQGR
jgi:hypothetical protein